VARDIDPDSGRPFIKTCALPTPHPISYFIVTDATSEGDALGSWALWRVGLRERVGDGLLESHCSPLGSRPLEGLLA
jgi:hypothetical protein